MFVIAPHLSLHDAMQGVAIALSAIATLVAWKALPIHPEDGHRH